MLIIYFIISSLYSLQIKKIINIDCITLFILYTIRIIAGGYAFNIAVSFWLLTFSFFIFLSLTYLKRFSELKINNRNELAGRAYTIEDLDIIKNIGLSSGLLSSVIISLYTNDEYIKNHYLQPKYIYLTVPIIVVWITNFGL